MDGRSDLSNATEREYSVSVAPGSSPIAVPDTKFTPAVPSLTHHRQESGEIVYRPDKDYYDESEVPMERADGASIAGTRDSMQSVELHGPVPRRGTTANIGVMLNLPVDTLKPSDSLPSMSKFDDTTLRSTPSIRRHGKSEAGESQSRKDEDKKTSGPADKVGAGVLDNSVLRKEGEEMKEAQAAAEKAQAMNGCCAPVKQTILDCCLPVAEFKKNHCAIL